MKRRGFAVLSAAGAASLALRAPGHAQPAQKLPRIGMLWQGASIGNPVEMTGFRQGLRDFGYVEGQNITVYYRFTEGRDSRIAALAAELMQLGPQVLVSFGSSVIGAFKDTTTIPVVSLSGDPVAAGVVASLARPGGHITGISMVQGAEGLTGKRIEILKDALPAATLMGMLFNPEFLPMTLSQAQRAADRRALVLLPVSVRRTDEIEPAIAMLARERVDAVDVEPGSPFTSYQSEIGRLLLQHRIPAIAEPRRLLEAGGLLSYGPNIFESARRMAYFVDRILKGTSPADLPVEQASRLELVVNMKTAKLLNIALPLIVLARADEVIE